MSAYSIATRGLPQGVLTPMDDLLFSASEPGAWYDPSDMSTLWQDSAGTVPVTAVEQPVGRILDKSGRGNHATQATTTKRPVLSRRVNLLEKTEQFDDVAWNKGRCSVTSNAAVGPDGLMSAEKVIADAQSNPHFVSATAAHKSGVTCRISVYAKAGEWDTVFLFGADNGIGGRFDLSLGTYVSNVIGVPIAPTITSVGGGWYLLALSFVTTADDQGVSIWIVPSGGNQSSPGNGVAGLYLWGADCRLAADAHLPYQWVNTDTDYDADPNKFPAYLACDGIDDAMQTGNIDFTGTDKMTVWAGSAAANMTSAAAHVVVNHNGAGWNAFTIHHPINGTGKIRIIAAGNNPHFEVVSSTTTYSGGNASVICASHDMLGSHILRVNSVQEGSSNKALVGNFANAPLCIGALVGATTNYFTGRLYPLIIRGAQSSLSQIEAGELYIKQKMRLP